MVGRGTTGPDPRTSRGLRVTGHRCLVRKEKFLKRYINGGRSEGRREDYRVERGCRDRPSPVTKVNVLESRTPLH